MDRILGKVKGVIKDYQLVGFTVGLIFAHFDHHISLYDWFDAQINEYNVVEEKKTWNPITWF